VLVMLMMMAIFVASSSARPLGGNAGARDYAAAATVFRRVDPRASQGVVSAESAGRARGVMQYAQPQCYMFTATTNGLRGWPARYLASWPDYTGTWCIQCGVVYAFFDSFVSSILVE
jgi:hypothetical protein